MQQLTIYSVISPEGCAAILWRDRAFADQAAEALKPTANDLKELGLIDDIIPEPVEGAHRNLEAAADMMAETLNRALRELLEIPVSKLLAQREARLRKLGVFSEA